MPKLRTILLIMSVCSLALPATGCQEKTSQAAEKSAAPAAKAKAPAKPAKAQVDRIVFIGQKQACDCTRKRIADSWAALESANATSPQVPVERIERDVQEEEAGKYSKLKAMMVAPGIYFLDAQGKLVEMLQGEVTQDQIAKLLH